MALELLPRELTRKQYGLRLLALFAFVAVGLTLFVLAAISGYVYVAWEVVAYAYFGFGLAIPRFRNAGKPLFWALFAFITPLNIIVAIALLIIREQPSLEQRPKTTRERMRGAGQQQGARIGRGEQTI